MQAYIKQQLETLNQIGQEELNKITRQYDFGCFGNGGNIEALDKDHNEIVIRGYSILNTNLFGIQYVHSYKESFYLISQLQYEIKTGKNECTHFSTMLDAENYLKKTKRKYLKNPYENPIIKCYSTDCNIDNYNKTEYYHQLKNLTSSIKLKKTIIQKLAF